MIHKLSVLCAHYNNRDSFCTNSSTNGRNNFSLTDLIALVTALCSIKLITGILHTQNTSINPCMLSMRVNSDTFKNTFTSFLTCSGGMVASKAYLTLSLFFPVHRGSFYPRNQFVIVLGFICRFLFHYYPPIIVYFLSSFPFPLVWPVPSYQFVLEGFCPNSSCIWSVLLLSLSLLFVLSACLCVLLYEQTLLL